MTNAMATQVWINDLLTTSPIGAAKSLQLIVTDLVTVCQNAGVTGPIELWESDNYRGFFVGETDGLKDSGWTKVATL